MSREQRPDIWVQAATVTTLAPSKVYLVLWFWYLFLFLITLASLLYWLWHFLNKSYRCEK